MLRFTAKIGGANKWVVKWTLSLSGLTSGSPLGKGSGNRPRPMRSEPFYWELLGAIFKRKMYLSPRKPTWQWKITIPNRSYIFKLVFSIVMLAFGVYFVPKMAGSFVFFCEQPYSFCDLLVFFSPPHEVHFRFQPKRLTI